MKKIISILLTAIMGLAFMLTAVGCEKTPENNQNTNVYGGYNMFEGVDLNSPKIFIVSGGLTSFTIVTPDNPKPSIAFAAEELSGFIKQITDVQIPISEESSFAGVNYISIGQTKLFLSLGIELTREMVNNDGFIIKTKGNSVIINGYNERGTLYGVYDFLEKFGGVRFVAPEVTHIPQSAEFSVHQMDILEAPLFSQRNYYNAYIGQNSEYELRTRMFSDVTPNNEKFGHISEWHQASGSSTIHNIFDYVPKSEYYADHPEFYASHSHNRTTYDDVCYANGIDENGELDEEMEISVAKAVLKSLKKFATEDESARFFMIGLNDDANGYCECVKSDESNKRYMNRAGTLIVFMNVIAREINKWAEEFYPGRQIEIVFFAYFWSEAAPVVLDSSGKYVPFNDKVVMEENLHVRIAPINANYSFSFVDERQKIKEKQLFSSWSALTNNFMIWDYNCYYSGYLWYFPSLNYLKDNLEYYNKLGASYVLNQSSYNLRGHWQSNLAYYVASKLYWHLDYDINTLVEEFITLYHGEAAAPFVMQFMDNLEKHYAILRTKEDYELGVLGVNRGFLKPEYTPLRLLEQSIDLINQAKEAVNNSTLTVEEKENANLRLTEVLIIPQFMILQNYKSYYDSGLNEFATAFVKNCNSVNALMMRELLPLDGWISEIGAVVK